MKLLARTFALIAALCAFNANANVFKFSYTFADNQTITGTMSGDLNGKFVDNISNVQVFFDGVAFAGPLFAAFYDPSTNHFDTSIKAQVSIDAALNNFVFTDGAGIDQFNSNYFNFINGAGNVGQEVNVINLNTGDFASDIPSDGSWSLTSVPEPANIALFLTGLGFVSLTARRSNKR